MKIVTKEGSRNGQRAETLVGVILTLNEVHDIRRSIASLRWCDSIVVVDSGSTDGTTEVAASLGIRVLTRIQEAPFLISEQRNWAVEQLSREFAWVVFLDADEEATAPFGAEVRLCIEDGRHDAYYAAPAFIFREKWLRRTSGFPNWHPRVVRTSGPVRFLGGVWEDFDSRSRVGRISEPYLHYPNSKGLSDWIAKHDRYALWEADRLHGSGRRQVHRRRVLRQIRYRLGPMRKYVSIFYLLVLRRGLLDGRTAVAYCRRMWIYELLIDAHLDDMRFDLKKEERGHG